MIRDHGKFSTRTACGGFRTVSKLILQVLYKRKPVQFLPPAQVDNEDTEVCPARRPLGLDISETKAEIRKQVWHIPQTGEIFASYDEFLSR